MNGPGTKYNLQIQTGISHSTFDLILDRLEKFGYVQFVSKKRFKTGLYSKVYKISRPGFFALLDSLSKEKDTKSPIPALFPSDQIWRSIESIVRENRYLFPWLADNAARLREELKGMELIYQWIIITAVSQNYGGMRLVGTPLEDRYDKFSEEKLWDRLAKFFIEVLFANISFESFWHAHYPNWVYDSDLDPSVIKELRGQIVRYLAINRSIAVRMKRLSLKCEMDSEKIQKQIASVRESIETLLTLSKEA